MRRLANLCNMVIVLGLFLSAYAGFQWKFSLASLMAMNCLAILIAGVCIAYARRFVPADEA
jgi:hypothetical protein